MEQKEFTGRGLHYSLVSVEIDGLIGANPVTCLSSEERGQGETETGTDREGEIPFMGGIKQTAMNTSRFRMKSQ